MSGQAVLRGTGVLNNLGDALAHMGARRVLLVTGRKSFEMSGAQAGMTALGKSFHITRFCDFRINPEFDDAVRAAAFARDLNIDTIVAVGGGSVMDMAKLILAFYRGEGNLHEIVTGGRKAADPGINFVAAPTTAGSGSESTHFAVVYYQGSKYSVAAPFLMPGHVVLDGSLAESNSSFQRAVNGLDALAQGIESYWAVGATEQSRLYARKAIPVLFEKLKESVAGKSTESMLQEILEAANFAGQAINISRTTAAHAYSYAFTSTYGIPHGQAVWLTLPAIFHFHYHAKDTNICNSGDIEAFHGIMEDLVMMMHLDKLHLREELTAFVASLGIETSMRKIGVSSSAQRLHVSGQVNMERMSNNPVSLTPEIVSSIFC